MSAAAVDDMARGMARRTVRLVVVVAMVGEVKCVGHAGSRERRGYLFLRERCLSRNRAPEIPNVNAPPCEPVEIEFPENDPSHS